MANDGAEDWKEEEEEKLKLIIICLLFVLVEKCRRW